MIRKIVIAGLTAAALLTVVVWLLSYLSWPDDILLGKRRGLRLMRSAQVPSWSLQHIPTDHRRRRSHLSTYSGVVVFRRASWQQQQRMGRVHKRRFGGFRLTQSVHPGNQFQRERGAWSIQVPLWALLLLFAAYPLIAFVRGPVRGWRRMRRLRNGLCLKCGYNLTANESGTCPECGTEV